jgi:hypothetical protein
VIAVIEAVSVAVVIADHRHGDGSVRRLMVVIIVRARVVAASRTRVSKNKGKKDLQRSAVLSNI